MIMSNWALAKISSRQRSLGLAGAVLVVAALLTFAILSQRDWRNRAAALERENTSLQLKQLARELTEQSDHLIERTRELAESDAALRLVRSRHQQNRDVHSGNRPPDAEAGSTCRPAAIRTAS